MSIVNRSGIFRIFSLEQNSVAWAIYLPPPMIFTALFCKVLKLTLCFKIYTMLLFYPHLLDGLSIWGSTHKFYLSIKSNFDK